MQILQAEITALPVPPAQLGESPFWHPTEQQLYWVDIPGHTLHRYRPSDGQHRHWPLDSEPGCCAPLQGGGLLLAMRDGIWRFDTDSGQRSLLAAPPYDPARQRFNDGKADAQGRFWVGSIDDQRQPDAALYRLAGGKLDRVAEGITVSNGLSFSPDGRRMSWADTQAHQIELFDLDPHDGSLSNRRPWAQFARRQAAAPTSAAYGGRPDGAAMDAEGGCWVAMFDGQRLLRLAPDGELLAELPLPVRCPTMPCFGGADLKTLYITTAQDRRPADEQAAQPQPLAGCVLQLRLDVPGLAVNFVRL